MFSQREFNFPSLDYPSVYISLVGCLKTLLSPVDTGFHVDDLNTLPLSMLGISGMQGVCGRL